MKINEEISIMEILFLPKFKRQYRKLPEYVKRDVIGKENIFRKNPFDPSLKTHKLHGKLNNCWAFSVNYNIRIIFKFVNKKTVRFFSIGSHDIYE